MIGRFRASSAFLLSTGLMALASCSAGPEDGSYVGYVEADWVYVSAPQSGWIVDLPSREGQRVAADDVLFRLDEENQQAAVAQAEGNVVAAAAQARDQASGARAPEVRVLQAQLAEAQANLEAARAERSRIMPLVSEGIESRLRGDQVDAAYREAQARVATARENVSVARLAARPNQRASASAQVETAKAAKASAAYDLDQRRVTARTAALVSEVFQEQGEFVTAGSPIVALLPADGLKVRFFVSQADLPSITIGKQVKVSADGLAQPVTGKVSYIAKEAEFTPPVIYSKDARGKLVFLIEATVATTSRLNPGLPVDVSVS